MWNAGSYDLPAAEGVYLVGGCVRDLLLGRRPADIDLVVLADARAYAQRVAAARGGRLVEIGKAGFRLYRVAAAGQIIDVSPAAGAAGIREDLQQRDFTINSLAVDLASGELIDIAAGRADLSAGLIRMVSSGVFQADPVRLVRAFRLAAQFGFSIEPQTLAAIAKDAPRIAAAAGERIREELFKLLEASAGAAALAQMQATGLLDALLPEVADLPGGIRRGLEVLRCLEAQREEVLAACVDLRGPLDPSLGGRGRVLLSLAALLHHLPDASQAVRRLKFSARDAAGLARLLRHRRRPRSLFEASPPSARATTRLFRLAGELTPGLLLLAGADLMADPEAAGRSQGFSAFSAELLQRYFRVYLPALRRPRPVGGEDLMHEFGLSPSPLIGDILEALDVERLSQGGLERGEALRFAADFLRSRA
ncbi:MAG: hypothetical protein R6V84_00685 [Desulfobacterales bacterium]